MPSATQRQFGRELSNIPSFITSQSNLATHSSHVDVDMKMEESGPGAKPFRPMTAAISTDGCKGGKRASQVNRRNTNKLGAQSILTSSMGASSATLISSASTSSSVTTSYSSNTSYTATMASTERSVQMTNASD